jgi:glyceraldehyde 3-phosphate dehydrogenase
MSKTRVAINGFGRIGRAFFKLASKRPELEIVAINDLGDVENLAYLLQYDSIYGKSGMEISVNSDQTHMVVDGQDIRVLKEKDPAALPWGDLDIDVVVESTGFFTHYDGAKLHLDAGAKKVVISAPAKGDPVAGVESATVLMGVNHDQLQTCQLSSNGSCTTNASSPVMQIMNETIGVEKAILSTVHGYTATQKIQDSPSKDYRKGRAAAANIIPTTTGAAIAVTKVITDLEGKFDGMAMRVPVIVGSIADITFIAKRETSVEEINEIFRKAATEDRWQGIMCVSEDPIVSSDIIGEAYGSIVDLPFTKVVDGNLVKVLAWYDNEMGYTNTLVHHVIETGKSV